MANQRERAEEQRKQKLAEMEKQVEDGSLVIRSMTPKEREQYTKPETPRRQRRRP